MSGGAQDVEVSAGNRKIGIGLMRHCEEKVATPDNIHLWELTPL